MRRKSNLAFLTLNILKHWDIIKKETFGAKFFENLKKNCFNIKTEIDNFIFSSHVSAIFI